MALTDVEYRMGHGVGNTGLGDGHGEHHGDSKYEQQLPIDIFGNARHAATAKQHHESCSHHGNGHEGEHMERRHDEHQHKDDGRGDGFGAQLGHEMAIEEGEFTTRFLFQVAIALWGALQQQGITCLNNNLTGLAFDTMTSTGYSDKGHIMILLEMGLRHRATNKRTTEVDIGGTHLALGVDIVDTPHMAVGGGKAVGILNLKDIVDLTGIYQAVATHHPLVFWYWHDDFAVETHNLNQRTSLDVI